MERRGTDNNGIGASSNAKKVTWLQRADRERDWERQIMIIEFQSHTAPTFKHRSRQKPGSQKKEILN